MGWWKGGEICCVFPNPNLSKWLMQNFRVASAPPETSSFSWANHFNRQQTENISFYNFFSSQNISFSFFFYMFYFLNKYSKYGYHPLFWIFLTQTIFLKNWNKKAYIFWYFNILIFTKQRIDRQKIKRKLFKVSVIYIFKYIYIYIYMCVCVCVYFFWMRV